MNTLLAITIAMSLNLAVFAAHDTLPENNMLATYSGISYRYQKVKVTLMEGIGKVRIAVLDEKGVTLHTDIIKVKENVVYPINMSAMPIGRYTIRITNKDGGIDHPVDIMAPAVDKKRSKRNKKFI